ncbi:MAG TPA: hypothetical protein VII51_06150 [Gaiellaceae bacterium]
MNTAAAAPRPEAEPLRGAPTFADRLAGTFPLLGVYVVLCGIYVVEVWQRVTPWLFTDELELTQLSRSIASTGHAARRGQPHSADSLYTYLIAPFWFIHNTATAYAAIKYADVFMMTAVVFPTYALARMLVRRPAALFAAAAAGAVPALVYSSYIVEEPLAYPYAALCFFLVAKALVVFPERTRSSRAWVSVAVLATLIAPAVKGELVIVPVVFAAAALFAVVSSESGRRRLATWSLGDWMGAIILVLGVVFVVSGAGSRSSQAWYAITTLYRHRIIVMGNWAAGALAIGIGVIPLVLGIAALFKAPNEKPSRELRMLRSTLLATLISFGLYTAMKAAYLSTVFETRVEERNLIYIAPILFIGTALVLERRSVNLRALTLAGIYVLYLVGYAVYHSTQTPYEMGVRLYSDAPGLSIAQQANLTFFLTPQDVRLVLIGVFALTMLIVLAPHLLPSRKRLVTVLTVALGVGIVGWNLTGEISAAANTNILGREFAASLERPYSWVDKVTKGRPTLYYDQGVSDQTTEWMLEFWNRSIVGVTSLDGTIHGPGPAGEPNIGANGTLQTAASPFGSTTPYAYAVESVPCVDLEGKTVAEHSYHAADRIRVWRLVALAHPVRFRSQCTGISPDGWSGPLDSAYYHFSGGTGGWLRIDVSRRDWSGPTPPTPVHILFGKLAISDFEPALGTVTRKVNFTVASGQTHPPVWIHVTTARFAARIVVDDKIVPCQVEPTVTGDCRQLGAEVSYRFFRTRPSA